MRSMKNYIRGPLRRGLLLGLAAACLFCGGCGGRGGAQHPAELLVHQRDLGTNDHLVLAVCLGNAHNTGQALDGIGIGFGFIFQVKHNGWRCSRFRHRPPG